MTMYNKIFTKILDSSVWLEPTSTRIVWITLIAAMDENGFCQFAAIGNVASRARVSENEARAALQALEGPDVESSDQDNEGRRIERVPGGWMVLNAPKYRAMVTRVNIQEKTRDRVRRFRDKKRSSNANVTQRNDAVTPSESETDSKAETESKQLLPTAMIRLPAAGSQRVHRYRVPTFKLERFIPRRGRDGSAADDGRLARGEHDATKNHRRHGAVCNQLAGKGAKSWTAAEWH